MKIGVVDYGAGNLRSISNALDKIGYDDYVLVENPDLLRSCDKVILPGVGAFGSGMEQLRARALDEGIIDAAKQGVPILGICLGMQFLATQSEEFGLHKGLDLIPGMVKKIQFPIVSTDPRQKVPLIAWKKLIRSYGLSHFTDAYLDEHFYFVHSFQFTPSLDACLSASYLAGEILIPAIVVSENITGVQFHPEKSGEKGLSFISSFLDS